MTELTSEPDKTGGENKKKISYIGCVLWLKTTLRIERVEYLFLLNI
jgi:hypothetical protein